jgi:hypothetical protein
MKNCYFSDSVVVGELEIICRNGYLRMSDIAAGCMGKYCYYTEKVYLVDRYQKFTR